MWSCSLPHPIKAFATDNNTPTIVLQKSAFNKSRVYSRAGKIGEVPKLRFLLNGASTKTQEAEFIAVLEIAN